MLVIFTLTFLVFTSNHMHEISKKNPISNQIIDEAKSSDSNVEQKAAVNETSECKCSLQWTELNSQVFFRPQMTYYYTDLDRLDMNFIV